MRYHTSYIDRNSSIPRRASKSALAVDPPLELARAGQVEAVQERAAKREVAGRAVTSHDSSEDWLS